MTRIERPKHIEDARKTARRPSTPMTANQVAMTGPKIWLIRPVPCGWMLNRAIRTTIEQRHDIGRDRGADAFQAFERAEHGNRRRDGAVSEQQSRAEHAHGDDRRGGAHA